MTLPGLRKEGCNGEGRGCHVARPVGTGHADGGGQVVSQVEIIAVFDRGVQRATLGIAGAGSGRRRQGDGRQPGDVVGQEIRERWVEATRPNLPGKQSSESHPVL